MEHYLNDVVVKELSSNHTPYITLTIKRHQKELI